jgi:hypothetical protein
MDDPLPLNQVYRLHGWFLLFLAVDPISWSIFIYRWPSLLNSCLMARYVPRSGVNIYFLLVAATGQGFLLRDSHKDFIFICCHHSIG